jgi:phospholipid/cholesterol/gamma-HCH transport system substrate-binding protein
MVGRDELRIGTAVIASVLVLFFGVRYLGGQPLLSSGYELFVQLDQADGLVRGNAVRVNGVEAGSVLAVQLSEDAQSALVTLRINGDVRIPGGSVASLSGLKAIGDMSVDIKPGPRGAPPVLAGDTLAADAAPDLVRSLSDGSQAVIARADALMEEATGTVRLLNAAEGGLPAMLGEMQLAAASARQLMLDERLLATLAGLEQVAANMSELSAQLRDFSRQQSDTLALVTHRLNRSLVQTEATLAAAQSTLTGLDSLVTRVNEGEGSLGLMLNDPDLYHDLRSTTAAVGTLLEDFRANPGRYLRELRLVKIF